MKNIDNEITAQLELLFELSKNFEFEEICEFSLEESNLKIPYDDLKISGLYLFEIKNSTNLEFNEWIKRFKITFRGTENEFLKKFTPNIIEKRIKKHPQKMDWIPFYIGKSKNMTERIDKHINSTLGKPPFALKLKGRGNLNNELFRLKILNIEVKNYDVIVPSLE